MVEVGSSPPAIQRVCLRLPFSRIPPENFLAIEKSSLLTFPRQTSSDVSSNKHGKSFPGSRKNKIRDVSLSTSVVKVLPGIFHGCNELHRFGILLVAKRIPTVTI